MKPCWPNVQNCVCVSSFPREEALNSEERWIFHTPSKLFWLRFFLYPMCPLLSSGSHSHAHFLEGFCESALRSAKAYTIRENGFLPMSLIERSQVVSCYLNLALVAEKQACERDEQYSAMCIAAVVHYM